MLEIRYKKLTGKITALASSPEFMGGNLKPEIGEEIIVIDYPAPIYSTDNYLIIDRQLRCIKEPEPPRDLATEITVLQGKVEKLENLSG